MAYINNNREKSLQTANPSKYPQGYFKEKPCKRCSSVFSPNAPSEHYCSDPCKDDAAMENYLRKTYNMSIEEYNKLYESNNRLCHICQKEGFRLNQSTRLKLVVDHCHDTGVVRGMLCHNCNRALGLFKDNTTNLEQAITYLKRATTISEESRQEVLPKRTTL